MRPYVRGARRRPSQWQRKKSPILLPCATVADWHLNSIGIYRKLRCVDLRLCPGGKVAQAVGKKLPANRVKSARDDCDLSSDMLRSQPSKLSTPSDRQAMWQPAKFMRCENPKTVG
jgi:hypothetical protein